MRQHIPAGPTMEKNLSTTRHLGSEERKRTAGQSPLWGTCPVVFLQASFKPQLFKVSTTCPSEDQAFIVGISDGLSATFLSHSKTQTQELSRKGCNSEPGFSEPAQVTPEPFLVGRTYMSDPPCQICAYLSLKYSESWVLFPKNILDFWRKNSSTWKSSSIQNHVPGKGYKEL